MTDLSVRVGGLGRSVINAPTFLDTFAAMASPRSLRGGDISPLRWTTYQFNPDALSGGLRPDHVRQAIIPAGIRSTFTDGIPVTAGFFDPVDPAGELVYPPNDTLVQDPSGARAARLMSAIVIQEYGRKGHRCLQAFDVASRTGIITFTVDAWAEGTTGTFVTLDLTEEPVPATGYNIAQNEEPGARPKNSLHIEWSNGSPGSPCTVGAVLTYANYTMTTVSASFTVTGVDRPLVTKGSLNYIQVHVSQSHLTIYESDCSLDDGVTFPNYRRIYEADITLAFSRGYVNIGMWNHSTTKFDFPTTAVHYWGMVRFDGPLLTAPRLYEVANGATSGHNSTPPTGEAEYDYVRLGWELPLAAPFSLPSVNIAGITSATLTLNVFMNAVSHTADTTWTLRFRFNGGTQRSRALTSAEVTMLNGDAGSAGNVAMAIDVPTGDLVSGTNTLDLDTVNVPTDYVPYVCNVDLLVAA